MHWKTKRKILSTEKIYLTHKELGSKYCYEVRFQLPESEYILIDLRYELPSRIRNESLIPHGFKYNEDTDNPIQIYNKRRTLEFLENTKEDEKGNQETIEIVIDLINEMQNLVFR
nr:hypothetical protein [uncultured Draconibacterium sp.]